MVSKKKRRKVYGHFSMEKSENLHLNINNKNILGIAEIIVFTVLGFCYHIRPLNISGGGWSGSYEVGLKLT